jgi:amidohydrolase
MDTIRKSKDLENYFINIREKLHQIPEIGLKEYKTAQLIRSELEKMGYSYETVLETGTIVEINNNGTKTIAFRADIDGLAIEEEVDVDYKSQEIGFMHACGHDIHTANLLTFAKYLKLTEQVIASNIVLIFQPAEEGPGGARMIIESGILEKYRIDEIHGVHIFPNLELNYVGYRSGPFFAKNAEINISVTGKGAHVAKAGEGIDALSAGSELVLRLAAENNNQTSSIIHIGKMRSGQVRNSVADSAILEGTMRSFDTIQFEKMQERIRNICTDIEESNNVKILVEFANGYEVVNNSPELIEKYTRCIDLKLEMEKQLLAEDFSFYQNKYKGVFWLFGIGPNHPLHSSKLEIDTLKIAKLINLFPTLLKNA